MIVACTDTDALALAQLPTLAPMSKINILLKRNVNYKFILLDQALNMFWNGLGNLFWREERKGSSCRQKDCRQT